MGQTIAAEYRASPTAMSEGQRRNSRSTASGVLVAGREAQVLEFTPVLDGAVTYADNDVLFIATEIPNFVRTVGGRSLIRSLGVFDADDMTTELALYITQSATTPGTINGAISGADSVMDDIQTHIRVLATDYDDLINSNFASLGNIQKIVEAWASTTSLYCWGAVRAGTPLHSTSGLLFRFGIEYID